MSVRSQQYKPNPNHFTQPTMKMEAAFRRTYKGRKGKRHWPAPVDPTGEKSRYMAFQAIWGGMIVSHLFFGDVGTRCETLWYFRRPGSTPIPLSRTGIRYDCQEHTFPTGIIHPDQERMLPTEQQKKFMEGGPWQPPVVAKPYPEILKNKELQTFENVKEFLSGCFRSELRDHAFGDREIYFDDSEGRMVATGYAGGSGSELSFGQAAFTSSQARELFLVGRLKNVERNDSTGSDYYRGA